MSHKGKSCVKFPWTRGQEKSLRAIWHSGKRIKENMHLFGEHSYAAVIMHASEMGLGKRRNCPRGASPMSTKIILKMLTEKGAMNRFALAGILGVDDSNTHKHLRTLHAQGQVHIAKWERRRVYSAHVPVYAAGKGEDAEKPPRLTSAEKERRRRVQSHQKRNAAGETVRGFNPFGVAMNQVMQEAS